MSKQTAPRTPEEEEAARFMAGLSAALSNTNDISEGEQLGETTIKAFSKKRKSSPVEDSSVLRVAPYPFFSYTDHSRDCDVDRLAILVVGCIPSFPIKLHAILSDPELNSIVSWDDHGRSFRVLKYSEFETDVLPRFFDHNSLASFQRQLNGWNFRRVRTGEYRNSYYEEHFLRSMPWLCTKMCRLGAGERSSQKTEFQPDLAAISSIYPLSSNVCHEIQVILEAIKRNGPKAKTPSSLLAQDVHDSDRISPGYSSEPASEGEVTRPNDHLLNTNYPMSLLSLLSSPSTGSTTFLQQHSMPMLSVENQLLARISTELQNQTMSLLTTLSSSIRNTNPNQNNSLENNLITSLLQARQYQAGPARLGQLTNIIGSMPQDNTLTLVINALAAVNRNLAPGNLNATTASSSVPNQLAIALQQQDMSNQVGDRAGPSHVSLDSSDIRVERDSTSNVRTLDQIIELLRNGPGNNNNLTLEQINSLFQQY